MADTEISNLVELAGSSLADGDPIAIVDASAAQTKKITAKNFLQSGIALVDDGSIPDLHEDVEGRVQQEVDDKHAQQKACKVALILGHHHDLNSTIDKHWTSIIT